VPGCALTYESGLLELIFGLADSAPRAAILLPPRPIRTDGLLVTTYRKTRTLGRAGQRGNRRQPAAGDAIAWRAARRATDGP